MSLSQLTLTLTMLSIMSTRSVSRPLLAGIIGYPLAHSLSPTFQQAALDHAGLNVQYERWETPPSDLAPRLLSIRRTGVIGANVTVPHKEKVLKLLDKVDRFAADMGAVNTIVNRSGHLTGYNTDATGFIRALKEDGHMSPTHRSVWVLGAGGAARGIVFALAAEAPASIVICNRTIARAQTLAKAVLDANPTVRVQVEPWGRAPAQVDLIVNATTMGMAHGQTDGLSPIDPSSIPKGTLVCDIVYNPQKTPLLAAAEAAGTPTLGGLPMLIYQGAAAFELWTGLPAPVGVMMRAARGALTN